MNPLQFVLNEHSQALLAPFQESLKAVVSATNSSLPSTPSRLDFLVESVMTSRMARNLLQRTTISSEYVENIRKQLALGQFMKGLIPADLGDGITLMSDKMVSVAHRTTAFVTTGDKINYRSVPPKL
jgi:hypothetical protein